MSFILCALSKTLHFHKHLASAGVRRSQLCSLFMSYSQTVIKPDLCTMKFDTPQFRALFTPEVKSLSEIFRKYGYELRIAGGAVRDLLMNFQPTDIDFATTATPEEMKNMFTTENIRMFNRKGEAHGTVTCRINDQQNFEITTLRVDLHTDGRHAEVEFTTNWELDASRRDLTINAMFLDLDGVLYDYFHGVEDVEERKVKFVGNPDCRIQEDYLRILRYFRFYGRIAVKPDDHDADVLQAIGENIGGLEKISGERLWVELKKTLVGNHVKHIILRMLDLGIAPFIGLPSDSATIEFQKVCERSELMKPHAITLLTALLKNEDDVQNLHSRLKFSKYDRELALFIMKHKNFEEPNENPQKPYKNLILESKCKTTDTQEWVYELLKYRGKPEILKDLKQWVIPKFPVNGHMLISRGFKSGPKLNAVLTELKYIWLKSDCVMSQEELLGKLDSISKPAKQSL